MNKPQPQTPAGEPWGMRHRLARALEHAEWKVQDMQDYLAVSPPTMTSYMKGGGVRGVPLPVLRSWAAATGTSLEWLRFGTGHWLRDGTISGPNDPSGLPDAVSSRSGLPAEVHQLRRPLRPTG